MVNKVTFVGFRGVDHSNRPPLDPPLSQTVFNINSFTIIPECLGRHWEFNLSLHTREFDLSHLPNPLDTNSIQ